MTYDDIAAIFLAPLDEPIPEPDVTTTPARRLRDALEPIATQGWWSRAAGEEATDAGQGSLITALGPRLDDVIEGGAQISTRLIATRSFPAGPRKRAGG